MTNFEKWLEDKPKGLQMVCRYIENIEGYTNYLKSNLAGNDNSKEIRTPFTFWNLYYRKSLSYFNQHVKLLKPHIDDLFENIENYLGEQTNKELKKVIILEGFARSGISLETFAQKILDSISENEDDRVKVLIFFNGYLRFANEIVIPSLLFYEKWPGVLLKDARHRKYEAVDQLLRMDKRIIAEKRMAMLWQHAMDGGDQALKNQMLKSISGNIEASLSRLNMKYKLGSLIMLCANIYQYNLSMTSLRDAFDCVAKDKDKNCLVDPDLPDSEYAFTKGIQREREKLLSLMNKTYKFWKKKTGDKRAKPLIDKLLNWTSEP